MTTASLQYKLAGIQRIVAYKNTFSSQVKYDEAAVNQFVNLFCEYQLADNNYMNIHFEADQHRDDANWYDTLTIDQVLQFITYIIWTDKFIPGYILSKIEDNTLFQLVGRAEAIHGASILSSSVD